MTNSVNSAPVKMASRNARSGMPVARQLLTVFGHSPALPLLLLLIGFFTVLSPSFLSWLNFSNLLTQAVLTGVLAIALTPVFISGAVDLSVGSNAGFAACLLVFLQPHIGLYPAVGCAIAASLLIGLINGLIVELLALSSIIVTLAVMIGLRGVTFLCFGSDTVFPDDMSLLDLYSTKFGPFGIDFIVLIVIALLTGFLMRSTVHGINTFAIGGNRRAAEDAGVDVAAHVIMNFAYSGALAGLVGVLLVAQLGAASPVYGQGYELLAIIAVVLGGTKLAGGRGTIIGTVVATAALTVLQNGVNLLNVDVRYVTIIVGGVLIGTLVLDRLLSGEPITSE